MIDTEGGTGNIRPQAPNLYNVFLLLYKYAVS